MMAAGSRWLPVMIIRGHQDVLGLNPGFRPKFLRTYANTFEVIQAAFNAYDRDVKDGNFPFDRECYEGWRGSLQIAKHAA
jgi:ketopantoate hydroxymethyltransferase